jgi:hypothetical protein
VAAVGVASTDRSLIADHFVAATAENQRAFDKARPILLAAPDGESPHMTAIHRHIAENHGAAGAGGIARGGGFQIDCEQMVGWQTCHRKSTAKAQVKFLREAFALTRDRPFAVNRITVQFS